jgi:hypothetical protein
MPPLAAETIVVELLTGCSGGSRRALGPAPAAPRHRRSRNRSQPAREQPEQPPHLAVRRAARPTCSAQSSLWSLLPPRPTCEDRRIGSFFSCPRLPGMPAAGVAARRRGERRLNLGAVGHRAPTLRWSARGARALATHIGRGGDVLATYSRCAQDALTVYSVSLTRSGSRRHPQPVPRIPAT